MHLGYDLVKNVFHAQIAINNMIDVFICSTEGLSFFSVFENFLHGNTKAS